MKLRLLSGLVAGTFVACIAMADSTPGLKSGPQVGENARPKAFFPLNVNGPTPDEKQCLVCRNGNNPVVMVFARDVDPNLTTLIKKVDEVTAKNTDKKMGSFAVFCTDASELQGKLKELAKKENLSKFTLSIDNPTGPAPYKIDKDADVTVVLYNKSKVIANYAFKKGDLTSSDVEKIVAQVPDILK